MDVIVRGKHVEVPDGLRTVAERKLAKIDRFTHDVVRVDVEFSEQRNPRIAEPEVCTVIVQLKRRVVTAHASGARREVALDLVIHKLEQQMARIKERRIDRSQPRRSRVRANGAAGVPGVDDGTLDGGEGSLEDSGDADG